MRLPPATRLKLVTHACRIAAYNTESSLARLLAPHCARAADEARSLLRGPFTLAGDLQIADGRLHVTLNPASAPRRSRALAALCEQLNDTETVYPGTNLVLRYAIKTTPNVARTSTRHQESWNRSCTPLRSTPVLERETPT